VFFSTFMDRTICIFTLALLAAVSSLAQTAKPAPAQAAKPVRPSANGGTVTGTVKDASGAVIPGVAITLTDEGGKTQQVQTGSDGAYTFRGVAPGTYSVSAAFQGMAQTEGVAVLVSAAQVAHGDMVMKPAEVKQEVTVAEENTNQLGLQASQNVDALVFKGADLAALPDDPDDLQQDLQALAGPSAGPNGGEIYIDGFSSGRLPPKESIREIRINQNPFSAEYDKLGFGRIEIFTKPGSDKFHGTASYDISDGVWNSRNPFLTVTPFPGFRSQTYGGNVSGPINSHASFFLDFERRQIDDNGILNAINPVNLQPDRGFTPTPQQRTTISPRMDWQLNTNNTLSVRYSYLDLDRDLWGVGLYNLPDSGYSYTQGQNLVQVTETAVLSTVAVNETRFQYQHYMTNETAQSNDPQVTLPSAFVYGGAGLGHTTLGENNYELQNYTTVTHGKHTIKFGARERDDILRYDTPSNFNGTFSFPTQAAYLAGQPNLFTISSGNPLVHSNMFDLGAFVQDDWRVTSALTVSAGLRWEGQTNIHDWHDAAPRVSFAWAPGRPGGRSTPKTVIRGGFGMFYIRYLNVNNLYTSEYNGVNQVSYAVTNPSFFYPNGLPPGFLSTLTAEQNSARFIGGDDLRAPYLIQSAIAVERQLTRRTTVSVNLTDTRGVRQFVTSDINAPMANGLRPDANIGDLFQYQSDGLLKQLQAITRVNTQLGTRVTVSGAYIWSTAHSNTDGTLCASTYGCGTSTPVNQYDLSEEWSRAALAVKNRTFIFGTVQAPLKIQLSPFILASSGLPFNITTGGDYLDDGLLNARPALASGPGLNTVLTPYGYLNTNPQPGEPLLPRNYGTGPATVSVNLRLSRTWGFGTTKFAGSSGGAHANAGGGGRGGGGGFGGFGGGGGGRGGPFGGTTTEHRYNLTLSVSARNMFNHVNYAPPVGIMGSPFFLQSTAISGGFAAEQTPTDNRRIDLQLRFQF
jgi:hypothetical protein